MVSIPAHDCANLASFLDTGSHKLLYDKKAISFCASFLQNIDPKERAINGQDQKIEAAALKARPDF